MTQVDLMIPGPVQVSPEVLQEMASPQIPHYGDEALSCYRDCTGLLAKAFGTKGNIIIMNGSGSVAFDACVGSLVHEGDAVIACINGVFGERNREIAACYGARVVDLNAAEGDPITADSVKRCIDENRNARAILIVHHETSTGVLNPLAEIGEVALECGIPVIADAVASLGIDPLEMDQWGVGLCASSSQKGLEAPAGLGFVAINELGWNAVESRQTPHHGWYSNLRVWKNARNLRGNALNAMGPIVTIPVNNIRALQCSLQAVTAEGLSKRYERHAKIAAVVRRGIRNLGFKTLPADEYASNGVSAVVDTLDIDVKGLIEFLRDTFSLEIGGGLGSLSGKIFRIGHIGISASPSYAVRVLFGIEQYLRRKGRKFSIGSSLIGFE